jgi:hypothetical protein
LQTTVCDCDHRRVPPAANLSIAITLSSAQVDEVLRAASGDSASSLATLISSTLSAPTNGADPADAVGRPTSFDDCDRRLSRSLLRGLAVLSCFTLEQPERGILELARELGLSASTTHRYVLTLLETGLLERCPRSRRYRLPRPSEEPRTAAASRASPQE